MCQGVNVTVHPTGLQGQFQGSCEWPRPPARVPCWARGGQGTPDALHQGHGGSAVPEGDALPVPSAAPGVGLGAEERGLTCHRPGSPTGEGGNSMHVCFVGTDYSNLVLYVRLEDAGEVTSLWALLGRWWLSPTPGRLPGPVLTAGGSRATQSCTPVGAPQVGHPCPHRSIPQEFIQPISCLLRLCPGSGDTAPEQKPSPVFAGEIACEPKSH